MTLESGQVLAARYALLRKLGDGGSAEIWLARDRDRGIDCVLKLLRPELREQPSERERILRGATLQRELGQPNVLPCLELHDGEITFAVFAADATGDLTQLRGALPGRLLPVLREVALALAGIHARGYVHRDLKTSNVLLTLDGHPLLTDFGLAARIGESGARGGGSPFTSSPEQLAGSVPAPADDVYSFGALVYELLAGYPPFYPDAAAARGAASPPTLGPAQAGTPPGLAELAATCLARPAVKRPARLDAVIDQLRTMPAGAPGITPEAPEAGQVVLQAPDSAAPVIQPQWQRPARTVASAAELRSQGFRRGLLAGSLVFLLIVAGLVFFALPDWVAERNPSPANPPPATPPRPAPAAARPEPDLKALADSQHEFEERRPPVAQRLSDLESRGAAEWGGDEYGRGKRQFADADAAAAKRDYAQALEGLKSSAAALQAVEKNADGVLRAAIQAGLAALEAGNAAEARRQLDLALRVDPQNATARRARGRVDTLEEVRGLLAEAAAAERAGQISKALQSYRKALSLDPDTAAARSALSRLESKVANDAFASAVADGLAALNRGDYAAAQTAYERAGRIRPDAPEVKEGLARIQRAEGNEELAGLLDAARRAEREEHWSAALATYRKALASDPNLLAAQQGVERCEPRAMLDAELAAYLDRPERMFSSEVRGAARATLARAGAIADPGPVLTRQIADVGKLVAAAETPVRVAIASDNLTEVTIYRVGKLGAFDHKDMELLPGKYTVVGTRAGFRDVRREITVLPGRAPPALTIRCEEPI
jgi:serine/threonine protein kinase/Flp pilus assembly protein TadD